MGLPLLQHAVGINPRILIIQAGDIAERDKVVPGAIHPRAAVLFGGERPAQRENDLALADASRPDLPQLLDADAVELRVAILVQIELLDQLLSQRTPRA